MHCRTALAELNRPPEQNGRDQRPPKGQPQRPMTTAHDFSFAKLNEPGEIKLADYAGKVVLVVNVASACGYTPQYRDLEALYEAKVGKGVVVLGVPCNDFGAQEPGADSEIRGFCDSQYHVTFPMAAKVEIVAPAKRHPFYAWVARELGEGALPRWNFHKFLIDKQGALVDTFSSKAGPLGPEVLGSIKKILEA